MFTLYEMTASRVVTRQSTFYDMQDVEFFLPRARARATVVRIWDELNECVVEEFVSEEA